MPATRPKQLFDQVKPRLLALGIQGLSVDYGPEELARHHSPPRIVWCKAGGEILPTDRVGGNPRPLVRRRLRFEARLWGRDDDQAEQLLEETIREVQFLTAGVYRPVSELWPQHAKPEESRLATAKGAHCILSFEVDLYVESRPLMKTKAKLLEFDPAGATPGDGVLQTGES